MESKFIVMEGIEATGKTTIGAMIKSWLEKSGITVFATRQPGGTALGREIRWLILDRDRSQPIEPMAELFLYQADRAQHVAQEIRPALKRGEWVICDRYTHSTVAYQSYGRGLDINHVEYMNYLATGALRSDLTILLDLDPAIALQRLAKRGSKDAIEQEDILFHERVKQGYLALQFLDVKGEISFVDASCSLAEVWECVRKILQEKILYWAKIEGDDISQWNFD